MRRYIIQFDPKRRRQVENILSKMNIPIGRVVFDYMFVRLTPDTVNKLRAKPGIIRITPDKVVKILQHQIPIDRKIRMFRQLVRNPLTYPIAPVVAPLLGTMMVGDEWPTGESRNIVGSIEAANDKITGKGVKVAVLDTGVDPITRSGTHWEGGKSSVPGQPIHWDLQGHGTHVGATVGGWSFPTFYGSVAGVAPNVQIAHFKCLSSPFGFGSTSWIIQSISDAIDWGADILNLSLGGEDEDYRKSPYHRIIQNLTRRGKIFVIAAGNSGPDPNTIGSPGSMPDALTIGAIDKNRELANFSSRGPTKNGLIKPDAVCPGVDILTSTTAVMDLMGLFYGPKLAPASGTSMATPHASGVIALALEYARNNRTSLNTYQIKEALARYGHTKNNNDGWGLLTYPLLKKYIDNKIKIRG